MRKMRKLKMLRLLSFDMGSKLFLFFLKTVFAVGKARG